VVREYYFRAAKAAWAELISNWRRELIYGLLGAGLYLAVAIPIRGKVDWLTLVPLAVPLLIFGWHFVRGPALVAQGSGPRWLTCATRWSTWGRSTPSYSRN
jgi:hypothetical protein